MSCTLERKEAFELYVRVGMGKMTDDAFNLELPSVESAPQTQKTATTKRNKSQKCSSTRLTNQEGLLKNKNETFFF